MKVDLSPERVAELLERCANVIDDHGGPDCVPAHPSAKKARATARALRGVAKKHERCSEGWCDLAQIGFGVVEVPAGE